MSAHLLDALEMTTWVSKATTEETVARLLSAEKEAFMWSLIERTLTPAQLKDLEQTAYLLREGGYRRPER